jgi:phosphohistidine phosphatase
MAKSAPRSRQGTMKRLYLLRHTKSSWKEDDLSDHERPLAPRGRRAAPPVGVYLRDHAILPDLVLASSARRTRETWELVSLMLAKPPRVLYEDKLYLATAEELLVRLRQMDDDIGSILLVGHNPGLQELAVRLFGDGDSDGLTKLRGKFPTGGLALYQFDIDHWEELLPGIGCLTNFVVPRDLV